MEGSLKALHRTRLGRTILRPEDPVLTPKIPEMDALVPPAQPHFARCFFWTFKIRDDGDELPGASTSFS